MKPTLLALILAANKVSIVKARTASIPNGNTRFLRFCAFATGSTPRCSTWSEQTE